MDICEKKKNKNIYANHLNSKLKRGGHAIIGAFSLVGAEKCSQLEVQRYGIDDFSRLLGPSFKLVLSNESIYRQPSGNPRPYIYALYQKL